MYVYMYIYIYINIHIYIYIYVCVCVCVCMYLYIILFLVPKAGHYSRIVKPAFDKNRGPHIVYSINTVNRNTPQRES